MRGRPARFNCQLALPNVPQRLQAGQRVRARSAVGKCGGHSAQLVLVDAPVVQERNQVRRKNAFEHREFVLPPQKADDEIEDMILLPTLISTSTKYFFNAVKSGSMPRPGFSGRCIRP